jgi:hypothetical protein
MYVYWNYCTFYLYNYLLCVYHVYILQLLFTRIAVAVCTIYVYCTCLLLVLFLVCTLWMCTITIFYAYHCCYVCHSVCYIGVLYLPLFVFALLLLGVRYVCVL